ncbi:hypothetical protein [Roseofilum casamattae]|uniref:Uma2 family endonuclease n=1 Tax=Roseofilum casamattae BLCC-M143 TaxID=3022442 RepID=A0ABT7C3P7_9CYAN|nr:hypothetical protein [Roseofilum casamattae]MDJ1185346.1 hypothetical protein [Roseofilum casamattae BLCC-M143]
MGGLELEVLSWFDAKGDRYLFSEEVVELERQGRAWECQQREQAEARARQERQQREEAEARAARAETENEALRQRLRELGIDPNEL